MKNNAFKTKFSTLGFIASILYFIPYLFIWLPSHRSLIGHTVIPKWLFVIYIASAFALFITLLFVENINVLPFTRKSRCMSIAFILLGIYYILWVYFFWGKSTVLVFGLARLVGSGFFVFINIDRRNWLSLVFSILFMIIGITISIVVLLV